MYLVPVFSLTIGATKRSHIHFTSWVFPIWRRAIGHPFGTVVATVQAGALESTLRPAQLETA